MKAPGSLRQWFGKVHAITAKVSRGGSTATMAFVILAIGSMVAQIKPVGNIRPDAASKVAAADTTKKPPVRATLDRSQIETLSRPAIPFKPFEMVDPATRKPIAPTAILTLPNGKRPTAQKYYSELNNFEKWLSEHGYSLRTSKGQRITLHQIKVDRSALQRQVQLAPKPTMLVKRPDILARYSDKNLTLVQPIRLDSNLVISKLPRNVNSNKIAEASKVITAKGIRGAQRSGVVISNSTLDEIARLKITPPPPDPGPVCQHIKETRPWNWEVGKPSTFHAYVNGALTLAGDACRPPDMQNLSNNQSLFNASAEAKVGADILGIISADMLRLTSNASGNEATGKVTAGMGVFVAGIEILNINKSATGHWGVDDQISRGLDFSTSIPIPVGPFDVDLTIGAKGEAGFQYHLSLSPNDLNIGGGPFVHSSVYVQAGVGIFDVVEFGAGASLTLVNWDMNLAGSVGYGWAFGFIVSDQIYIDSNVNLLSGKVYAFAKVIYPCFDLPPWCWAEYDHTLFSWNGYNFNSVLFDENNIVKLNW
jgi:hypothetical protein